MEKCPVETGLFYFLKYSMRKFKIFITILLIYEFAILTILQIPRYCNGLFSSHFCDVSFRYFLMCIVIPGLFGLFVWWLPQILRMFCGKCQCEVPHEKSVKDNIKEMASNQDIERLITAILVSGMQKFIANHPKTTETLSDILKTFIKPKGKKRLTK